MGLSDLRLAIFHFHNVSDPPTLKVHQSLKCFSKRFHISLEDAEIQGLASVADAAFGETNQLGGEGSIQRNLKRNFAFEPVKGAVDETPNAHRLPGHISISNCLL